MQVTFAVIEPTSGNVAGDYSTEQEALARLRQAYDAHGATAIADLSLMRIEDGDQQVVVMQDALVDLDLRRSSAERGRADRDVEIVATRTRR